MMKSLGLWNKREDLEGWQNKNHIPIPYKIRNYDLSKEKRGCKLRKFYGIGFWIQSPLLILISAGKRNNICLNGNINNKWYYLVLWYTSIIY